MSARTCPHCSDVPTSHWFEYFSAVLDDFFEKYLGLLEIIRIKLRSIFVKHTVHRWLFMFLPFRPHPSLPGLKLLPLTKGGLGGVKGRGGFDNHRQQALYESAVARGIELYRFFLLGRPTELLAARRDRRVRIFFTMPRPLRPASESFDWIDDKEILRSNFEAAGFPMARGGVARTENEALELFNNLDKPVIVKPSRSSRGRHVQTNIDGRQNLSGAFRIAKQLCPWVVVEEHLPGVVHRITLIDNKIAAVIRKDYPSVQGDGVSTVMQLIEAENRNPRRDGVIFHPLKVDENTEKELQRQNLYWDSVPKEGRRVILYNKPGRQLGSTNTDVTDDLHPDNMELFARMGKWMDEPLVGIDFMIEDIFRSWREQKCGVIEANTMPFIDIHHYPYEGKQRDVAGKLWDIVF